MLFCYTKPIHLHGLNSNLSPISCRSTHRKFNSPNNATIPVSPALITHHTRLGCGALIYEFRECKFSWHTLPVKNPSPSHLAGNTVTILLGVHCEQHTTDEPSKCEHYLTTDSE